MQRLRRPSREFPSGCHLLDVVAKLLYNVSFQRSASLLASSPTGSSGAALVFGNASAFPDRFDTA